MSFLFYYVETFEGMRIWNDGNFLGFSKFYLRRWFCIFEITTLFVFEALLFLVDFLIYVWLSFLF